MTWKTFSDFPDDDKTYLVSYKKSNGRYSNPIRAYYSKENEAFFALDTTVTFPLAIDEYCEIPMPES